LLKKFIAIKNIAFYGKISASFALLFFYQIANPAATKTKPLLSASGVAVLW